MTDDKKPTLEAEPAISATAAAIVERLRIGWGNTSDGFALALALDAWGEALLRRRADAKGQALDDALEREQVLEVVRAQLAAEKAAHEATKAELKAVREEEAREHERGVINRRAARLKVAELERELGALRKPLEGELAKDITRLRRVIEDSETTATGYPRGDFEALARIEVALRAKGRMSETIARVATEDRELLSELAKGEPCGALRGEPENDEYPCVLSAGHVGRHVDRDGDSFHGVETAKGGPQAVEMVLGGFGAPGYGMQPKPQAVEPAEPTFNIGERVLYRDARGSERAYRLDCVSPSNPRYFIRAEEKDNPIVSLWVRGDDLRRAPAEPRPIVVGSKWRHRRSGRVLAVTEVGPRVVWVDTGNDWHIDEFRAGNEWMSDPPATPAPELPRKVEPREGK